MDKGGGKEGERETKSGRERERIHSYSYPFFFSFPSWLRILSLGTSTNPLAKY
jgi:hypothetical protein